MTDQWHFHLPGEKERKLKDKKKKEEWAEPSATKPIAKAIPRERLSPGLKFDVRFLNAAAGEFDEEEEKLTLRVENMWKAKARVFHRDRLVMEIEALEVPALYVPGRRSTWEARVVEGMDLSLVRTFYDGWEVADMVGFRSCRSSSYHAKRQSSFRGSGSSSRRRSGSRSWRRRRRWLLGLRSPTGKADILDRLTRSPSEKPSNMDFRLCYSEHEH